HRREDGELEGVRRVQRDQQHHQRARDAGREHEVEQQRRQRQHEQSKDRDDPDDHADLGGLATAELCRQAERAHIRAHSSSLPCPRTAPAALRRMTNTRTSATATYSSGGIGSPMRTVLSSARAHGLFSITGTPASCARRLIRSAILRCPMARTIGAAATPASYLSATAMCVGFVTTTSAFATSANICLRSIVRASERRRERIIGSPSVSLCSCLTSSFVMRSRFSCCQTWKA